MAIKQVSPTDTAWIALESRDTPMHVGGLWELSKPADASDGYLQDLVESIRETSPIPQPWNLKLVDGPVVGPRLPLMQENHDIDLEYHVRHSALPHPGGQRELGMLISRLHSHQLDLHRPLWELHVIEGLEGDRFALYTKVHHALIDGVSAMRHMARTLSTDPDERDMPSFLGVGPGGGSGERRTPAKRERGGGLGDPGALLGAARGASRALEGLARAGLELTRATVDSSSLQAPYRAPGSVLGERITGQRRFATQQYDLDRIKALGRAAEATLNDLVLYLCSTALRRYLAEHEGGVPNRSLTAGIPVNLREAGDESIGGTEVGMLIAELGTNVSDPRERIERIKRSTTEAKRHQRELPRSARVPYTLLLSAPYIAGLLAGLGDRTPAPFSIAISNVHGPTETLYFNGARLDAMFPLSLLTQGAALNITCVSYAGTLNFGFTGARDTLPHLQRLAVYMGEAVEEIEEILLEGGKRKRGGKQPAASG